MKPEILDVSIKWVVRIGHTLIFGRLFYAHYAA
jgi:hypothetical protein